MEVISLDKPSSKEAPLPANISMSRPPRSAERAIVNLVDWQKRIARTRGNPNVSSSSTKLVGALKAR